MAQISYSRYGDEDKALIIWIHGGGLEGSMWDKQIEYFKEYNNIIVDLPDHGSSKNMKFTMPSVTELLYAIIEKHKNGKPVYMVGFSLGAQVIVEYLSLNPNHIDKAVIISGHMIQMKTRRKVSKHIAFIGNKLVKFDCFLKKQAKSLYIDEDYYDTFCENAKSISKKALNRIINENARFEMPESFEDVKTKCLLLYGENECKTMIESAELLKKTAKNIEGFYISNVGHGISLAKPDLFNRIVKSFFNEEKYPENIKLI